MDNVAELYPQERADKQPYGEVDYADPGYQQDKVKRYPLDSADHCRAAWSYINMPKNAAMYSGQQAADIKARIKAAAKRFGVEIAGEPAMMSNRFEEEKPRAEIETRGADVTDVHKLQRIITVVAAPYEKPALITYRGDTWQEMFERTAWNGLRNMARPGRIRANRGHNKDRTVGKVVNLFPDRPEGLVAEIRCAQTPLGDETLALAVDDCVSASVGFGVLPDGQILDKSTRTRRITTAYLDHIAFVESPAYQDATVLGVRAQQDVDTNEQLKLLAGILAMLKDGATPHEQRATPGLDQFTADEMFRWAAERLA